MKIICKEKDFYDFVGFASGNGIEDVTFDRRNMWMIKPGTSDTDNDTIGFFVNSILTEHRNRVKSRDIGLWLGNVLHIFRLTEIENRFERNPHTSLDELSSKFKWKAEFITSRRCYDIKHSLPVEFVTIETGVRDERRYNWNSYKQWKTIEKLQTDLSYRDAEYRNGIVANWEIKSFFESWDKIPILKNTWVPSFISSEVAYHDIEEWLIAQYNDKDQESKILTDIDKVINHGFDKRSSFRNVK